jgi:hypothetical protein
MGATALQQSSTSQLVSPESTSAEHIDIAAREFLKRERAASEAYDRAYMLDTPHEHAKMRLISLLWTSGLQQDDWKILRGSRYEARLKLVQSETIDTAAICRFRYALIREIRPQGLLTDIFKGTITYRFTDDVDKIIAKFKMSERLTELYRRCRPAIETPVLEVRAISS